VPFVAAAAAAAAASAGAAAVVGAVPGAAAVAAVSFYEVVTPFHAIPSRFFVVHFPIKKRNGCQIMKRISYTAGAYLYVFNDQN